MPSSDLRPAARLASVEMIGRERRTQRAAGIAGRRLDPDILERPVAQDLPLATQFSATPPARHRFCDRLCAARLRVSRSIASSGTACIEAARSMWIGSSSYSGTRGGTPNSRSKRHSSSSGRRNS